MAQGFPEFTNQLVNEVMELEKIIQERNNYILELRNKLRLQEDRNHTLTGRLAEASQEHKAEKEQLVKMIEDLTSRNASMADTIERLEEKNKRSLFGCKK